MLRYQSSIAGLLVLVGFTAVAAAALRRPSELWQAGVFSLAAASLVAALLLAVRGRGRRRAFWLGFALCGGVYLVLSLEGSVAERLITSRALVLLHDHLRGSRPDVDRDGETLLVQGQLQRGVVLLRWPATPDPDPGDFQRVGHSLLALVVAYMGGSLARTLRSRV